MSRNYWQGFVESRLNRRRLMSSAAFSGAGAAALTLVGCGGGSDSPTSPGTAKENGLLSARVDTTKQAKPGGVLQTVQPSELAQLDSLVAPQPGTTGVSAGYLYGRLLKFKPGIVTPPTGDIEGDLAESWELSADKLTLSLKLRPNVKLDSRPPTNGRFVDSGDVVFSANKVKAGSDYRADLFNEINPLAPVTSITAPDKNTVVMKLASPDSLIMSLLSTGRLLIIQPVEAAGGFDPRREARGWGPWRVKSLQASVKVEYEKNPDYYVKGLPYLDGISIPFIGEYATTLAQFRAQNIWTGAVLKPEDIIPMKKNDFPELTLLQSPFTRGAIRGKFGVKDPSSPFKDERVRQAFSMFIDRQLLIDTIFSVDVQRKEGIPVETRWHTALQCGWDGTWMDPNGKEFGENGKYYKFDPNEAKKLLAAAGHSSPIEFDFIYASDNYGAAYQRYATTLGSEIQAGFKVNMKPQPYTTTFFPTVGKGRGNFVGFGIQGGTSQGSPQEMLRSYYHSQGAFAIDAPSFTVEKDVDDMLTKLQQEFDTKKQTEMMKDIQRFMAKRMRMVLDPGDAAALNVSWPWVGNAGVYTQYDSYAGIGTEYTPYLWIDETKRKKN
jgi:peptide/nickel transport system substrate-binding protein